MRGFFVISNHVNTDMINNIKTIIKKIVHALPGNNVSSQQKI